MKEKILVFIVTIYTVHEWDFMRTRPYEDAHKYITKNLMR